MKNLRYSNKSVICYFSVLVILCAIINAVIIGNSYTSDFNNGAIWIVVLMFVPSVSAFIAAAVDFIVKGEKFSLKEYFGKVGFRKCEWKYIFMAFLIPLFYSFASHGLFWILNPGSLQLGTSNIARVLYRFIGLPIIGTVINMSACSGEEIGWRGFMVPALNERIGLKKTLLVSSIIWSFYHIPVVLSGAYLSGASLWYCVPALIILCSLLSIIIGIWSVKTQSVWPAAVLHSAHNCIIQSVLAPITVADNKMYFVDENGIFTLVFTLVFAIAVCAYEKKHHTFDDDKAIADKGQ